MKCKGVEHINAGYTDDYNNNTISNVSWSAYFANFKCLSKLPGIIALLPLFRDSAHSPAMAKHRMDIVKQITCAVNPGQILFITVDQPLYAISKKIQWTLPHAYGKNHQVYCTYGGGGGELYIEVAMYAAIGDWFGGSGWTSVMTTAGVTTEGRALGLQKGSHSSRAQWAHQVSASALFIRLKKTSTRPQFHY